MPVDKQRCGNGLPDLPAKALRADLIVTSAII